MSESGPHFVIARNATTRVSKATCLGACVVYLAKTQKSTVEVKYDIATLLETCLCTVTQPRALRKIITLATSLADSKR